MRVSGRPWALVVLTLTAGCALVHTPRTLRHLDDKYGFREVRFGTPQAEVGDLEFVETRAAMACFERRGENLEVAGVTLGRIRYCFHDGRLASVALWGTGADTGRALLRTMRDAYGEGERLPTRAEGGPPPVAEIWRGERVTAVYLFVEPDGASAGENSEVVVTLSSNELIPRPDGTPAQAP